MNNIKIFKEKVDGREDIFFQLNEEEKKLLIFDNLVSLAETFLVLKKDGKDTDFNLDVGTDSSLELYRNTMNELLKSVLSDSSLQELFNKNHQSPASVTEAPQSAASPKAE